MLRSRVITMLMASYLAATSIAGASAAGGAAAKMALARHISKDAPVYPRNVLAVTDITTPAPGCSSGSYRLDTSDPLKTVAAWYRTHLPKGSNEIPSATTDNFIMAAHGKTTKINLLPGALAPHGTQVIVGPC